MKNTLLFIYIALTIIHAQTITNVQARQEGLEIIITYDMAGGLQKDEAIKVGYSTDGGRNEWYIMRLGSKLN
jgi:hypothetical protein